jgi:hypothetical protein
MGTGLWSCRDGEADKLKVYSSITEMPGADAHAAIGVLIIYKSKSCLEGRPRPQRLS